MAMTPKQVREKFSRKGMSIAEWAREHSFNKSLVYSVVRGQRKAMRGQTHDIAVKLGLKDGTVREG